MAETIAVSIGWLSQNPAIKRSEPATASKSRIARIAAVRRPGRNLDIDASVRAASPGLPTRSR